MLLSLDIETKCALQCTAKCDHALIPHQAQISCVGIYYEVDKKPYTQVYRHLTDLQKFLRSFKSYTLVGQNLKFDIKHLAFHGIEIPLHAWADDTQLMGAVSIEKVTPDYLEWYNRRRVLENAKLPKGYSHREAKRHSLKVMAPFFLGVEPFWEDPSNHDNDEYVLKDCEYTYRLRNFFEDQLKHQDLYNFYRTKTMPWAHMLLEAELAGMPIDINAVQEGLVEAQKQAELNKEKLDKLWAPAYYEYRLAEVQELRDHYYEKARAAKLKSKNPTPEKLEKVTARYSDLLDKALAKVPRDMNLNSPAQLSWILKDYLKLDITDFDDQESTGKPVLKKLASTGREDILTFLEYRKHQKLATAFFPSYLELQHNGKIHCSFNVDGTRTGRLSSSGPNLQQVPGDLHKLFVAPPGMKVADFDMAAIEAKLIAYYTEDPNLYYLVNSGDDFHGFNVVNIYFPELTCKPNEVKNLYPKQRAMSKELGYALFYGAAWERIQNVAQKHGYEWSEDECKHKLGLFRDTYETVWNFKKEIDQLAKSEPIENIFGRKAFYPEHEDIYMKAFNTLIQGTASDLVVESASRIRQEFKRVGIKGGPRLLVHDEIVTVFAEDQEELAVEIIKKSMTDYNLTTSMGPIKLEVEGKVGYHWAK